MESKYRRHITREQKKLLIKLIKGHPRELLTGTVTSDFSHQDFQRIWREIAFQCNALPGGAEKTWKQWRKCWQDLRHRHGSAEKKPVKTEKTVKVLSAAEKDKLLQRISTEMMKAHDDEIETEFANFDQNQDTNQSENIFETEDPTYGSDDDDVLPETKVFDQPLPSLSKKRGNKRDSHGCEFNCETLATQEERKVQMKEDFYTFKKDYLQQKISYMKAQAEAFEAIARNLGDKSTITTLTLNGENM